MKTKEFYINEEFAKFEEKILVNSLNNSCYSYIKNDEDKHVQTKYHCSWDWIIPIYKKLKEKNKNLNSESDSNKISKFNELEYYYKNFDLENFYYKLFDFIKKYEIKNKNLSKNEIKTFIWMELVFSEKNTDFFEWLFNNFNITQKNNKNKILNIEYLNTKESMEQSLKEFKINNYTIHDDLTIDVDGNVDLSNKKLDKIPFKFGVVTGDFYCYGNILTSLEGSPKEVGGDFMCFSNQLSSLEGSPKEVGGDFSCSYNKLSSLEGSPEKVGGGFYCSYNKLTSLEGSPKEVGGDFSCYDNKLTSLEGSPKEVGGDFICSSNQLSSLEGSPKEVGGDFSCYDNPRNFTEADVRKITNVKMEIYV